MQGLSGKSFIVTGGGSGIGAASVRRLLSEGANVIASDISAAGLDRTRNEVGHTEALKLIEFDLADEASIVHLVREAAAAFGALDGVASIAADVRDTTMARDVQIGDFDVALWEQVMRTNLIGSGVLIRESLPHLVARGGGSIINFSTAIATTGNDKLVAYQASKNALHAVTRHTARVWGKQGIRINAISPGFVLTETAARIMPQEQKDDFLDRMCVARAGTPEDLAASVAFLLSDDAAWITGQVISVDGGLVLRE